MIVKKKFFSVQQNKFEKKSAVSQSPVSYSAATFPSVFSFSSVFTPLLLDNAHIIAVNALICQHYMMDQDVCGETLTAVKPLYEAQRRLIPFGLISPQQSI